MKAKIQQRSLTDCLANVIDYRGKTPKKLGLEWSEIGYRAISANNVKFDGLTKIDSINCLDESGYKKWMKEEVRKGDLLLTSEAPAGQVMLWMSDEKIVLSQRLFALRTKSDVYNKYLKYYLQSNVGQFEINKNTSGSTVFGISAKIFDFIKVNLPEYNSQVSIGDLLYLIDSKIELNNRINAELEAMAKTIYDYWFVQFDFPDKNGMPYKSSGGKMVWNEELKMEIPEGWEVKDLGRYASIKKGILITEKTADSKGKIKVVSAGIDYSYFHSEANCPENTITISASGASSGYINFWREPIFACDCTTVRGKNTADTLQILGFLKMRQEFIYKQARGSAQPHVYPKDIEGLSYPVPTTNLVEKYGELVVSGNQQIAINLKQNQQLVSLRDWLLPMLMNGQVKIS
jgi:type I restriction enzyme S subunit